MGVYVFPMSQDREVIEQLAGVPAGTYDQLTALSARYDALKEQALGDPDRYEELGWAEYEERRNTAMDPLNSFILFGFGKLYSPAWEFAEPLSPDPAQGGKTSDPAQVEQMLRLMGKWPLPEGLTCESLEGLCWG